MVRRFVKNQDMGSHLLQTSCTSDTESTKSATVLFIGSAGVVLGHETDSTVVKVQSVDVVLGEESDSETRVLRDQTRGRIQLTNEKLKNSCLTGTVGSDDTNSRIKLDVQIDVAEQNVVFVVAESNFRHLHDRRRELLDFGEVELDTVLGLWGLKDRHLLEFLDT
ncbi:hypothetical protein HG531_010171 [Fusarium graminearum]|nr:hypothetical protein HG531_010171 [Fusarium graminearum]